MSEKNWPESEAEKPLHPLPESGAEAQSRVPDRTGPTHAWDTSFIDELEIKPVDILPGQGSLLSPTGHFGEHQREVQEAIEALAGASEAIKKQLWVSHPGIDSKLHGLPVGKVSKFSVGSEADADRTEDAAERKVEEIRSALQESRRLGESSERRLEELRQQHA
jgi:hypothetical protein